ncbi:uncharacterized protein LOC109859922 isoform X1 [Pseudomyrmex gracilis]|uniref:uncharacterized protein LOC109859922 isoform X1 n=1 Tax=Pseudomyrmex gracilis TaxID=219809 RepID=UPI000994EF6A|nr:uncharacterized protein LOC109859922 isoform X1 [Pseudomyrmex gracilis]
MKYSRMQRGKKWSVTSLGDESCSRCGVCLTKMLLVLLSVLLCSSLTGARLQIQKLDVPSIVDPRWESVSLRCEYDLGGKDLYSVTWYKDDQEFFNYKPSEPKRDRGIDGVYVDLNLSNSKQVTLLGPNYHRGKTDLAGSYGCEVSSEGPSFETDYKQANMSVAVLPEHQPVLNGMRPSYEVGEILEAECTSALSYPPAVLTFILNSKEVNRDVTRILQSGYIEENVISLTRLGLTIRLERHHFPGGTLTLTCQATLPGITGYKPLNITVNATLAANNQRLVEPPRKSGSRSNFDSCLVLIVWIMATIHSAIRRDNLELCV